MTGRDPIVGVLTATLMIICTACSNSSTEPAYNPVIPTDLSATVDNQFFPLAPGTKYTYSGQSSGSVETNTVEVMAATRIVNGVEATEVHDQVFSGGELTEDTYDWYAQDGAGNVWYLGEDSKELQNGVVVGTAGSWEWGINGALPGIIMHADPASQIGVAYRQEYLKGVAEDWGRVKSLNQSVIVPYGSFTGCLVTDDWNGLESGSERKTYCPGIGVVSEVAVGGGDYSELVDVTP